MRRTPTSAEAAEKRPGARLLFRRDLEGALRLVGEKVKNVNSPGPFLTLLTSDEAPVGELELWRYDTAEGAPRR